MRRVSLLVAALVVLGGAFPFVAQGMETVEVPLGKQRSADRGRLHLKFLSVIEDSRCPMNARCVWAGNAKIKLLVTRGRSSRTIELNTGIEPRIVTVYGYDLELADLRPQKGDPRPGPRRKTAVISVSRR